jgi:hypothetical protein
MTLVATLSALTLRRRPGYLCILLLSFVITAAARPDANPSSGSPEIAEMVTDRPDFTESSEVVQAGWYQLESGFAWQTFRQNRTSVMSVGAPLLRLGLGHKIELRLGSEGMVGERATGAAGRTFGRADSDIGFKYRIAGETRVRPAMAVIAAVSLPTGSSAFRGGTEPFVKFALAKGLPLGFSASGNVNWAALPTEQGRLHQKALTLSVSRDLVAGFGGYWEVFGLTGEERGAATSYMFAAGMTRAMGNNAQWDSSISHRLGAAGPDWVYSCGFSFRHHLGVSRSTVPRMSNNGKGQRPDSR